MGTVITNIILRCISIGIYDTTTIVDVAVLAELPACGQGDAFAADEETACTNSIEDEPVTVTNLESNS